MDVRTSIAVAPERENVDENDQAKWGAAIAELPSLLSRPRELAARFTLLSSERRLQEHKRSAQPGEPYGRCVIHRDAHGEVMLATWSGQQSCAPHDHGGSSGAVLILEGSFVEARYGVSERSLLVIGQQTVTAGTMLSIAPDCAHCMSPMGPGFTLHVYSPPIAGMKVFDRSRDEWRVVPDDNGAWIPRAARDERMPSPGPKAGERLL